MLSKVKYVPKYISFSKRSISAPRLRLIGPQTHRPHQYFDFKIAQRTLFRKTENGGSMVKNLPVGGGDTGDVGLIPELGRSLEVEMANHYSILAWRIPWTEEPGGLQSMGS